MPLGVQGLGTAFNTHVLRPGSAGARIHDYRSYVRHTDSALQRRLLALLQDGGVRVTSRGAWFLSAAHNAADIESTLDAARGALQELASVAR